MGRYEVSQRRAARAARFCRASLRYESRRDPLTVLRQRLRELLAQTRVRFGYRRLLVMMHREGWDVGKHRFYRVYTEEGLGLRRKRRGAMRPRSIASAVDRPWPAMRSGAWTLSRTSSRTAAASAR
jgi:putative transposase